MGLNISAMQLWFLNNIYLIHSFIFYILCQGGCGKNVFPFPSYGHAPRPGVSTCQNCQSCKTSGYTFNCLLHQLYTCDIKSVGISELYFLALKRWFDSDGAAQVDYSFSGVQQQRCCIVATQRSIQLFNCPTCTNLTISISAANRLIVEVVQSRRRPLLGPSPGWKRLLALSHLRHY